MIPGGIASASPDALGGTGSGGPLFGPSSEMVLPASVWITATAGGLALFLLILPRGRRRQEPVAVAAAVGAAAVILESSPVAPPLASKRAPALANVPSVDDDSVARYLRPSDDGVVDYRPPSPGSGAIKRRTQSRPRTTRDLQAGS